MLITASTVHFTFMSNAMLESSKEIFGIRKPSKFNVPWWNERAKEFNGQYGEAVSHWNIAGRPRGGILAELKCGLELPSGMK